MKLKQLLLLCIVAFVDFASAANPQCGKDSTSDKWSWAVNLRYWPEDRYLGVGSLISEKHVLTVAQCFQPKGQLEVLSPDYITASVVDNSSEYGEKKIQVFDIAIHPDWKFDSSVYDADVAVVTLKDKVVFGIDTQPVCLPLQKDLIVESVEIGKVLGWLKTDQRVDERSMKADTPTIDSIDCFSRSPKLGKALSSRSFCAGSESGPNAVCVGYPGNGFHSVDESSASTTIQGMQSGPANELGCNRQLSLYTRVSLFVNWIEKVMADTNEIVLQNVEMKCVHQPLEGDIWVEGKTFCNHALNQTFGRNIKMSVKLDQHERFKNARDVQHVQIDFKPSERIFQGIGESFPNLDNLGIGYSIKFIERRNFENMKQLQTLSLSFNLIRFIPEDAFMDLPNLSELRLWHIKLEKLPANLFANLKKLTFVELSNNKLGYLPENLFANNLELAHIQLTETALTKIDVDFTKLTKISYISLSRAGCIDGGFYGSSTQKLQDEIKIKCT